SQECECGSKRWVEVHDQKVPFKLKPLGPMLSEALVRSAEGQRLMTAKVAVAARATPPAMRAMLPIRAEESARSLAFSMSAQSLEALPGEVRQGARPYRSSAAALNSSA